MLKEVIQLVPKRKSFEKIDNLLPFARKLNLKLVEVHIISQKSPGISLCHIPVTTIITTTTTL
ncbi:MAG: hypothetical protein JWQ09_1878 [Segetibacter sp.]|nr:hypothetical protein [Segetibacter sp.]